MMPVKSIASSNYLFHHEFTPRWKDCDRCSLCETRKNIVLARSTHELPCDVLFVGEGPGKSEDIHGKPFWGPAGHLLNNMIARTDLVKYKLAFTNLVCCIPLDDEGQETEEPPPESIKACLPRLLEFVALADPKLVIAVGRLAEKYADEYVGERKWVPLLHPAAIKKAKQELMKSLMIRKTVAHLMSAAEKLEAILASRMD
jgi:uracil-DNA glycosylase family 4